MGLDWRAIKAIMRKDLMQVLQNKMLWMPMIIVPAIIQVIMPLVMVLLPTFVAPEEFDMSDLEPLIAALPSQIGATLAGLSGQQQWVVLSANYMFAPMYLIVPLMVSNVLAADGFAGEKERKTLEALLYSPISEVELFVAKLLTGFIPSMIVSLGAFVVYGIVVNLSGYPTVGRIFFPTASWWPLVFWLGPGVALVGLRATVLISSKAKSAVQAQQVSGILVMPIVFLMIAQISGLFYLGTTLVILIGLAAWILGLWLIWIGARTFARNELIAGS